MYGEILVQYAEKFREKLKEGNVCLVRDFFITSSKNVYRAVDGNFMIKITPLSTVEVNNDVIGIVSGISDIPKVRLPAREQELDKRSLQITDIDGNTMEVALWVEHATSF